MRHSSPKVKCCVREIQDRWLKNLQRLNKLQSKRAADAAPSTPQAPDSPPKQARRSQSQAPEIAVPLSKRPRVDYVVQDARHHSFRDVPTPHTPKRLRAIEPLVSVLCLETSETSTVRLKILPRTLNRDGNMPLEMNWARSGDAPIWKVALEWSQSYLKLPGNRLPCNLDKFLEAGISVLDAAGNSYDPSKTLIETCVGRICATCNDTIHGAVFKVKDGSAHHFGCVGNYRTHSQLDMEMRIEWPARSLPKNWGKKSKRIYSRQCEACGENKTFKMITCRDAELKTIVFCVNCH